MKAETSETVEVPKSGESTVVVTPDSASQAGTEGDSGSGSESGEADTTASASHTATSSTATAVAPTSASIKGKGKAPSVAEASKKIAPEPPKSKGKNLVGRINNLVSSDLSSLENISMYIVFSSASSGSGRFALADTRNAIPPAIESPFQITLCIIFLYQIMGWRYARPAHLFFPWTKWMADTLQRAGRICSHAPDPSCSWLHHQAYPGNAAGKDETSEYRHISHVTWNSRRCHIDGFSRTICH